MCRRLQPGGMADVVTELRDGYEAAGYDVDQVSENRDTVDVSIQADSADVDELRRIAEDVCGESAVLGFDVAQETSEGDTTVGTVVSFRHRP
jgi:hypothetical protein